MEVADVLLNSTVMELKVIAALLVSLFSSQVIGDWDCSIGRNGTCFQLFQDALAWDEAYKLCAERGAELPGAHHKMQVEIHWNLTVWSSLCYLHGRLQWLGSIPYEERDWKAIDKNLPLLAALQPTESYCFDLNGAIHPVAHRLPVLCVTDQIKDPVESEIRILSARVEISGADIDWGPIGVNRSGFVNILGRRHQSFHLTCQVETEPSSPVPLQFKWLRNGAYMGVDSQNVSFPTEEHLLPWIGLVTCEASVPGGSSVPGTGFHLSLWNTVTLKVTPYCRSLCQWNDMVKAINDLTIQVVTNGFGSDRLNSTRVYILEGPLIEPSDNLSVIIHLRNSEIDQFDFHLIHKLGSSLSYDVAEANPPSTVVRVTLTPISPCNLKTAEDDADVTWVGYLGQLVPSGNFIGGPICVDEQGHVVTRSCGLPTMGIPNKCAALESRRPEPTCLPGYEFINGTCYRLIKAGSYASVVHQCWLSWQLDNWSPASLMEWVNRSVEYAKFSNFQERFIWLPVSRPIALSPLMWPIWNGTGNKQWMERPREFRISSPSLDFSQVDRLISCVAYDLQEQKVVSRQCREPLSTVCSRAVLERPLSQSVRQQKNFVGRYFCPDQWVSHWLILDRNICYRRFESPEAITWDQAADQCRQNGAHLAIGSTQHLRLVLEQVYEYFNNRSVVDSWIGLRMQGDGNPAKFVWADGTENQIFNWQPYNEFGNGYGVSTGISRMWWTWPPQVKLWGFICQKQVPPWIEDFNLNLKRSANGQYVFRVHYNPPLDMRPQFMRRSAPPIRPDYFACYVANYELVLKYPTDPAFSVQFTLFVPAFIRTGKLVCEIWFNQPPIRIKSNQLVHQSNNTFTYIIQMRSVGKPVIKFDYWADRFPVVKDLQFKLEDSWWQKDESNRIVMNYRVSVNASDYQQLIPKASSCPGFHSSQQTSGESGMLRWIQSCIQNSDQFQFKVLSTAACQDEPSGGFRWRRTAIGTASRPIEFCLISKGICLQRLCGGNYLTGASWDPVPDGIECEASDEFAKKLDQIDKDLDGDKKRIEDKTIVSLLEVRDHFRFKEPTGAQVQLTMSLLKKFSNKFPLGASEQLLVKEIINEISCNAVLEKIQLDPSSVADLIHLLSSTPLEQRHHGCTSFIQLPNFQPIASGHFLSSTVNMTNITITVLRDPNETNNFTIVVLPDQILPDDGIVYRRDPADPEIQTPIKSFFRTSSLIHVQASDYNRTEPILLLQFQSTGGANYTCASWDPTSSNTETWISNACRYMGRRNGTELCQCPATGTFALFRHGKAVSSSDIYNKVPTYVAAAIFWLMTLIIVVKFYVILPKEKSAQAMSFELCKIENRILLQLHIAWCLLLLSFILEGLVSGSSVACFCITTLWQYFLFASMGWLLVSEIYHRRQLLGLLMINPTAFWIKISFFAWGLPSIVLITIPLYKWENLVRSNTHECWLDHYSDLWFTLGAIVIISVLTCGIIVNNCILKKELVGWNMTWNDYWTTIADVFLLTTTAMLACSVNSTYYSTVLEALFSLCSSVLALLLFFTYRRLLSKGLDAQPTVNELPQDELWEVNGTSSDHLQGW